MTARAALANERDRARRVVRVFWRVRDARYERSQVIDVDRKSIATNFVWGRRWLKVYRVTVRRVKR